MATDEELNRDWKPNGRRPQSTIARSFSAELMDIFRIENSVADLGEQIDKRKQQVSTQASELEALEARIRDMEAKLKRSSTSGPLAGMVGGSIPGVDSSSSSASASRGARNENFDSIAAVTGGSPMEHRPKQQTATTSQDGQSEKYGSRPGTARASQQAVPGALPPTPVGSEDGDAERD